MDERYLSRPDDGVIRAAEAIDAVLAKFDGRPAPTAAEAAYRDAAESVALIVLVMERVRTEPDYLVRRDVQADALRRKSFDAALARFRAASEALHAERPYVGHNCAEHAQHWPCSAVNAARQGSASAVAS